MSRDHEYITAPVGHAGKRVQTLLKRAEDPKMAGFAVIYTWKEAELLLDFLLPAFHGETPEYLDGGLLCLRKILVGLPPGKNP